MTLAGATARLRRALLLLLCAVAISLVTTMAPARAMPRPAAEIQILSLSDWQGQLDPQSLPGGGQAGGAALLSAYWKADRAANPSTITLATGDAFGASPPLSGICNEEPAVQAMNLMGVDADTLGHHEFDRGVAHLQQMIDLANSPFVSANLQNVDANLTGVKPYAIFATGGVKVGVIGITNPDAHDLVTPGNFGTIEVTDPVPAAEQAAEAARQAGAQVLVALVHLGATTTSPPAGPLIDFANRVQDFDLIIGGQENAQFSQTINGALVVETGTSGTTYARTSVRVDAATGHAIEVTTQFVTAAADDVTPDQAILDLLAPYRTLLRQAFDGVIGVATGVFARDGTAERMQETAIGDLDADALRWRCSTQLAVVNGGSIRNALPSDFTPDGTSLRRDASGYASGPPYDLVLGDAYTVHPFFNVVVTREVTGAQLWAALENGVSLLTNDGSGTAGRFLQVSGFRYTFDSKRPAGSRVVSVTLDGGAAIARDATTYTLATSNFVNSGGDGFTMLADGKGEVEEPIVDDLRDYIEAVGTIAPATSGRIVNLGAAPAGT